MQLSTPIPPPNLINFVSGNVKPEDWGRSRADAVRNVIIPELEKAGTLLSKRAQILDFGCGCGRILAGWEHLLPAGAKLYGIDINPALIAFCQTNIKFVETSLSQYEPPTRFASGQLDPRV